MLICAVLALWALIPAQAAEGYLRTPDLHGDRVVFAAEGDLWLADAGGGTARRLTIHVGTETHPKFSPDGSMIAFTGQYDGNADVFIMPAEGGEPRRLTWHPWGDDVLGFTPDGKHVLFRSRRNAPHGSWHVYTVPVGGGDVERLPLGWCARLEIDAVSGRYAFTRTERERRTWKRYRGGTNTEIWIGDPKRGDYGKITDSSTMNAFPMWHGGRVYYLGDAGGTANLWSMSADGSDRKRHTDLGKWDARFPSMAPDGRIVYMLAGGVQLFDPATGRAREIEIDLPSDRVLTRSRYPQAATRFEWVDLTPEGDRLLISTRGELFSVPVEEGVTLPVTRGTGARERYGTYDAEGKQIVYVSDESGEEQIRIIDAWGRGEPRVLAGQGDPSWHFAPTFSPDGKWIAWADNTQTLWIADAEKGNPRKVDRSEQSEIRIYTFSRGGRWLAYVKREKNEYRSVFIYDTKEGEVHRVTDGHTDDYDVAWDPEGNYLYFMSSRTTDPMMGWRDFQNVNVNASRPYLVLLRDDVKNPFAHLAGMPPEEDEDAEGEDDEKKGDKGKDEKDGDKKEDEKKDTPEPIEIDLDGLARRVVELPVPNGQYGGLIAGKGRIYYSQGQLRGMTSQGPGGATVMTFSLKDKKAKRFAGGVRTYDLSDNGEKMLLWKGGGELFVVGAGSPPGDNLGEHKVALDGVVVELEPREEWSQIYYEAWRQMREFYWDPGMGGVDWKGIRDQYATLLPRLATRDDLRDLIGEIIGELSTSHTYVFGGDRGVNVPRVPTGLLGADLEREGDAYRVTRIYRGDPADRVLSPLDVPGVDIDEGDYILAVNQLPFRDDRPFIGHLEGMAGKEVLLTVNDKPDTEGARQVVVVPTGNDGELHYSDWVRRNREYVADKSGGKIGYVHVPDMGVGGLVEFNTWFYPQLDKEGMIVDVRWNGGGFVSQMVLERLRRKPISFDRSRGGGVTTYPARTLNGPFVVLTNQFAGSDGDIFPTAVQLEKLAPVIGMRSWGGVIGIRGDKNLQDGGGITQPEFAWWDARQGWDLENYGVDPDIEVENLPQDLARGKDDQLDRGITEVLRLHAENPPVRPDFGKPRQRGREDYRNELRK
ncbi:hypothetical protein ABI59_21900 [Acidobacteria bacterium Mor1]|nr:hypothetical protein ABI59_21900 [Acidobacteria bacterium Mor1]